MWIITLSDNSTGDTVEVVAYSLKEVSAIVTYADNSKGILELVKVEPRWLVFGLQGLKDMTNDLQPAE